MVLATYIICSTYVCFQLKNQHFPTKTDVCLCSAYLLTRISEFRHLKSFFYLTQDFFAPGRQPIWPHSPTINELIRSKYESTSPFFAIQLTNFLTDEPIEIIYRADKNWAHLQKIVHIALRDMNNGLVEWAIDHLDLGSFLCTPLLLKNEWCQHL